MTSGQVQPVISGTAEIRRAASGCCGATLNRVTGGALMCGQCGQPCDLVYGSPEVVTLHG